MNPDWETLLVALDAFDAQRALSFWSWMLDEPVQLLCMSKFGDWFFEDRVGAVHRLDVLEGKLELLTHTRTEFEQTRSTDEALLNWFQDGMCSALHDSGMQPGANECFGYRVPPILGGSLLRDNVIIVNVASWQMFVSQLHAQVRNLPPGARITSLSVNSSGVLDLEYVVT